jgi:hypothetical protein
MNEATESHPYLRLAASDHKVGGPADLGAVDSMYHHTPPVPRWLRPNTAAGS